MRLRLIGIREHLRHCFSILPCTLCITVSSFIELMYYTGTYMMETRRANVNAERKCFHFDWKQSAPAKMRRRKMQTNFWNRFLNDANCFRDTPFMVQQSNINCILYGNICVFIYHLLWCGCTQWRLDTTYARNSQLHNFHIVFSFFFFFASFVLSCVTAWCLGERWTAWMHFFFFCWNALPLTTATNTSARSFFRLWSRFASNNNYANVWADRKWAAAAVQDPSNKKTWYDIYGCAGRNRIQEMAHFYRVKRKISLFVRCCIEAILVRSIIAHQCPDLPDSACRIVEIHKLRCYESDRCHQQLNYIYVERSMQCNACTLCITHSMRECERTTSEDETN